MKKGTPIGAHDMLIAAHARALDAVIAASTPDFSARRFSMLPSKEYLFATRQLAMAAPGASYRNQLSAFNDGTRLNSARPFVARAGRP